LKPGQRAKVAARDIAKDAELAADVQRTGARRLSAPARSTANVQWQAGCQHQNKMHGWAGATICQRAPWESGARILIRVLQPGFAWLDRLNFVGDASRWSRADRAPHHPPTLVNVAAASGPTPRRLTSAASA
jgi:hypothetical protein